MGEFGGQNSSECIRNWPGLNGHENSFLSLAAMMQSGLGRVLMVEENVMRIPWLEPLRHALDGLTDTVTVFFRDDDVGWGNAQLFAVLELFAEHGMPIDLAVIPQSLTPRLALQIATRVEQTGAGIGLHQHGFAHINHQASGRKCEFGSERTKAAQHQDIALGQRLLREEFGALLDPIFTPPWNRCTEETAQCLVDLGFQLLSRESRATPFHLPGLAELPVSIDWFAHQKGVRVSRVELGHLLADAVRQCATGAETTAMETKPHLSHALAATSEGKQVRSVSSIHRPIGIMLHHARMDRDECAGAKELLTLLGAHERVRCRLMRDL